MGPVELPDFFPNREDVRSVLWGRHLNSAQFRRCFVKKRPSHVIFAPSLSGKSSLKSEK